MFISRKRDNHGFSAYFYKRNIKSIKKVAINLFSSYIHHSEEETKDVFYYSFKYFENGVDSSFKYSPNRVDSISGLVRCAPMGISPEDAVHNNFTTDSPYNRFPEDVKFTVFKA